MSSIGRNAPARVPIAILDACVLVPFPLCDTLLRVAEKGLYRARWSDAILDEVQGSLIGDLGIDVDRAEHRVRTLRLAFPEADVRHVSQHKDHVIGVDPKDQHVVAVAVTARADTIVTHNLRHFPPASLEPFGIEVQTPDAFLLGHLQREPAIILSLLLEQSADTQRPQLPVHRILDNLARDAPVFSAAAMRLLDDR